MRKTIVVPESPLDTKKLSDVLKRPDVTVTVKMPVQNGPKETHYYVRQKGTIVCECVIRTFRPSLEIAELEIKKKLTKNSTQKPNSFLEPEKKQELYNLVREIEAKAFHEPTK